MELLGQRVDVCLVLQETFRTFSEANIVFYCRWFRKVLSASYPIIGKDTSVTASLQFHCSVFSYQEKVSDDPSHLTWLDMPCLGPQQLAQLCLVLPKVAMKSGSASEQALSFNPSP